MIKSLRNAEIIITKPDKGNGVVLLDRSDYFSKLETIVKDRSKFMHLRPSNKYDKTAQVEMKFNRVLQELRDKSEIEEGVYNQIRSTRASRPRLNGLPKTQKKDCPLLPILSIISSAQHKLAQYLSRLLQPVCDRHSAYCVKDSFRFENLAKKGTVNEKT